MCRNTKVFADNGIHVTGIEISKTAIELARQNQTLLQDYNKKLPHKL